MLRSNDSPRTVERMFALRGRILQYYATVEFILADLVVRCRGITDYRSLDLRFPLSMAARLRAAKAILESPGPLYSAGASELIGRLERWESTRHDLAHGHARTFTANLDDVWLIEVRRWERRPDGTYSMRRRNITPEEFEAGVRNQRPSQDLRTSRLGSQGARA